MNWWLSTFGFKDENEERIDSGRLYGEISLKNNLFWWKKTYSGKDSNYVGFQRGFFSLVAIVAGDDRGETGDRL